MNIEVINVELEVQFNLLQEIKINYLIYNWRIIKLNFSI